MRCSCCNKLLTDEETSLKWRDTGEYSDTCYECLGTIDRDIVAPFNDYQEVEYEEEDPLEMFDEDYWDER